MTRPKAYFTRSLLDLPPVPDRGWTLTSFATLGEGAFAAAVLRASEGDPFETPTPESALSDLREMTDFVGDALDPHAWVVVADERGELGVVLPQRYPDEPTRGTLFYLGVVPSRRGEGLGRELHLWGLHRLREQGATDYLGSTDLENAPMLAIFTANGCARRPDRRPVDEQPGDEGARP